ncbi:hypothetical protein HPULCUR_001196 [Helicostylum pulchrum]|uniref:Mitochondrial import receptor subunit TOM70 n=1 Tax=Helicostylum pulchrum TaxID=562976 RepID=A0ABP9XM10_9FUNG
MSRIYVRNYIDNRDWKFYVAIVLGITLAGTSAAFLICNQFYHPPPPPSPPTRDEVPLSAYESMTDAIISVMTPEQRLSAANVFKTKGNLAFNNKDYAEAIRLYTQAIRFQSNASFYASRAACYANMELYDKVLEDCSTALLLNPTFTKALYCRAQALEKKGDLSEALFDYTCVCILEGFKNENAALERERILKRVSEEKAKQLIKIKQPRFPSATFVSAYFDCFRPDSNMDIPSSTDTVNGDAYYAKARRALAEKKYEEAFQDCQKAIVLGCSEKYVALALNLKGTLAFLKGDANTALTCLHQSIQLDPTYIQSYIKRASILMELGDTEDALQVFEKAIELSPMEPDIYYHRGQVYYISGDYKQAILDYEKSLMLDPSFVYAYIQLAVAQYKLGMVSNSIQTFEQTIKKFSQSSDSYNYYGEVLADKGDLIRATDMFNKAMSLNPNHPLPYINKAMIKYQSYQIEEAVNLCKSALEADPACDAAVASLAQMYLDQDRYTEALKYYEKAIDLARTEKELRIAISFVEATRMQIRFLNKYPKGE